MRRAAAILIPFLLAAALPKARLVTLKDCGHFAYLECPEAVRKAIVN